MPLRQTFPSSIALRGLLVCLPLLATLVLIYSYVGGSLANFVPREFDEIGNWHETLTFSQMGFGGGYYTFEEAPAPASFSHFDTHGPFFTMLTAAYARVFGWHPYSMVIINLVALAAALAVFVAVVRPQPGQSLLLGALLLTFSPLLLYLPSNWQESLHQSIGILMAALFYAALKRDGALSRRLLVAGGAFIFAAALVRLTWAFMLIPFVTLAAHEQTGRRRALDLALAGLLIGVAAASFWYFAAPYSLNFTNLFAKALGESPGAAFSLFRDHTLYNFNQLKQGHPLEVGQRLVYLLVLAVCLVAGTRVGRRLRLPAREVAFHALNLGLILFVNLLVYDLFLWRDYRVLAPHLLLSLLLLIAFGRLRLLVGVVIAANLALFPAFLGEYRRLREAQLFPDTAAMAAFEDATRAYLVYDAGTDNAWCNTVLISGFGPELLALPPGVGFSAIINPVFVRFPVKSQYLLLRDDIYAELADGLNVERLADTSLGALYRNRDADCP